MKILFLFICFATSFALGEPNYREQFYDYFYRGDFHAMEATLKNWKSSCPDDVEMLAAYGSYYFNLSKKGTLANPAKLIPREEILLSGNPSGKKSEGPDPEARFDQKKLGKAADYWKKAADLYPWRMDIRFWLARAYQDLGNFDAQYQTLAQALQYADKNKKKLKWNNNEDLPDRRSRFIPESMQDFEDYYFARQRAENDQMAFRLAKLTLTFYPNHPDAYNSMAAYYSYQQDWEHTLKYLLLAGQKDPQNGLVLNNIGNVLMKLDKRKDAEIYYQKVVNMNNDEKNVDHAKRKLKEIKEE